MQFYESIKGVLSRNPKFGKTKKGMRRPICGIYIAIPNTNYKLRYPEITFRKSGPSPLWTS